MSTSSSSNASANTGPNRFRGDAASFSPSAHSPSVINQQILQQQIQQQQLYSQYMYANGGSMIPNQFYQYMPQYVMPNSPTGAAFHPEMAAAAYYPYNGYLMPPPQLAYKQHFVPNMNGNMNFNQRPRSGNLKRNTSKSTSPANRALGSTSPQNITTDNSGRSTPLSNAAEKKEKNLDNQHQQQNETIKRANENDEPTIINNNEEKDLNDDVQLTSTKNANDKIPFSCPLFFNSNSKEFSEHHESEIQNRKALNEAKYERLRNLVKRQVDYDKGLLIATSNVQIVNYNSNTVTITNQKFNPNDDEKRNDYVSISGIEATSFTPKSNNWASVLQSAPVKKPIAKQKTSSTTLGSSVVASTSLNNQVPKTVSPLLKGSSNNTNFDMNGGMEQAYPLGVLLLKIMLDPSYSVLNSEVTCPEFKVQPRGLTNTGNICYMNSILQILLFCEPFNKLLKMIECRSIGSLNQVSTTPLLDATIKFFNEFLSKSGASKPLSPEHFYLNLIAHKKFQHLKWGQQEDAEEFLGYYLDGLNEELLHALKLLTTPTVDELIQSYSNSINDPVKLKQLRSEIKNTMKLVKKADDVPKTNESNENDWSEVGSNNKKISIKRTVEVEPTPIANIFGGQFKSVLTIPKSANQQEKSITMDPFQNIQLDISGSSSIEEAFTKMNHSEQITFNKSNKEILISKQTFIDKTPNVLIIHLKRFSYLKDKDTKIEKIKKKVTYGHHLTLPPEILSTPNLSNYRLFGVVYHHGSSAEGGHYTCDVLRSSNFREDDGSESGKQEEWIRIDDTSISTIGEDDALDGGSEENTKNAYILFYQKTKEA
ncbi:uncharacterized protein PRCAT00003199001 [Priceomyces carsonii]|uniref:uncharacterized protein n=1 Tax=Priceomyces carsonii TaxID=28549 RepID=UPI002ED797C5|nr:unnamed protein product [Priceomyces carsonii]